MADCRAACDLAMVMLVVVGGFTAAGIVSPCCEVCLAVCCRSGVWPGLLRWVPGFLVHLILELNRPQGCSKIRINRNYFKTNFTSFHRHIYVA